MKRRAACWVSVAAVSLVFAGATLADSSFTLDSAFGILRPDLTPMAPGSLVQMIWTADYAYHPPIAGLLDAAGYLTSGDYILWEGPAPDYWFSDIDGTGNYTSNHVGGATLPSGWVYARAFDTNANPQVGCWFYQTELILVTHNATNVPPEVPQPVDLAPGGGAGPNEESVMNMQVIPEPMSVALLGVGLASVAAWRARKR